MAAPSVTTAAVGRELAGRGTDWRGIVFGVLLVGSLIATLSVLLAILGTQLAQGWPVYAERGLGFITAPLSSDPAKAGIGQGLVGSIAIGLLVSLICFPLGVVTAVYLEEYAPPTG